MIGLFLPLAALAQQGMIANSVSSPPVVVQNSPPTPNVLWAVPRQESGTYRVPPGPDTPPVLQPLEPVTVWVRIFSGRKLLLSDQLRVARYNATDILTRNEAPAESCPPDAGPTIQSTLTFQINRQASTSPDEFFIGLSWSHAVDDCKLSGSRGVSIAQPVTIRTGQPTVVNGDGGLRIELSRP